jgi:hypothetical protein
MANHQHLPIYRVAYDLFNLVTNIVANMRRDFKQSIGNEINRDCLRIVVLIARANAARDKTPYLNELLERLQVVEFLCRITCDKKLISPGKYASVIELTNSVGKQASGWRRSPASPVS